MGTLRYILICSCLHLTDRKGIPDYKNKGKDYMAIEGGAIDTTMYEVCAMESDNLHVKVRIDTVGLEADGFVGFVTETAPRLEDHQSAVIKNLGGAVTHSLGRGHSTVVFTRENARNLFPKPEESDDVNGKDIGQAIVNIFFSEDKSGIPY